MGEEKREESLKEEAQSHLNLGSHFGGAVVILPLSQDRIHEPRAAALELACYEETNPQQRTGV